MSAGELTIAWTASEAVLLGPDSRLVRQPLHPDDDSAAVILEAWRTEFPEALAARLLTGDPATAPAAARLAALAADAGLRLERGTAEAGQVRRPWAPFTGRTLTRRSWLILLAVVLLVLGGTGWQWNAGRLAAQRRQSADEERSAERAADGRRRQETAEQRAEIAAACAVPPQFQAEWLQRLANAPAAVVLEAVELNGLDCLIRGRLVPGAPGAEGAVDALRRSQFVPADRWQIEAGPSMGSEFALHAVLLPPGSSATGALPIAPGPERARLPTRAQLAGLRKDWAAAWSISAEGSEARAGVELQRFRLTAVQHDPRAWSEVLRWMDRWHQQAGLSVDQVALKGSPAQDGTLDRATVRVTVRVGID